MNTPEEPNPFRSPDDVEPKVKHGPLVVFWVVLCIAAMIAIALLPLVPGVSVMLVIALAPAFVHAHVRLVRRAREGMLPKPLHQLGIVLGSLAICTLLAFGANVVGGVLCISSATLLDYTWPNMYVEIAVAILLGIVFPFVLYCFLFAGTLGYFRRQQEVDEGSTVEANQEKS